VTKKATKKSAAPAPAETPGVETPEGATEQAEADAIKGIDADRAEEKAGGEVPADKSGSEVANPKSDAGTENEA
jgi:hypothetical protein